MQRTTKWALAVATVITLLIGVVTLSLVGIAKAQDSTNVTLTVLQHQSKDHSSVLEGISKILNLKGASVKAIVNGQNDIIGYLVTNDKDDEAICSALPTCRLP